MEKGKFGVRLCFYGVCAFILAGLGYFTPLILLAGVVLVGEKNEWAIRQVIQAMILCLIQNAVSTVLGVFDFFYRIPVISSVWSVLYSSIDGLLSLLVIVLCIMGIIKNIKNEDAEIPFAGKFAAWACGAAVPQKAPAQTVVQPQTTTTNTENKQMADGVKTEEVKENETKTEA